MNETVKKYEIGFLLKSEEDAKEINKTLEKNKANILKSGEVSKIKLAYKINKEQFASFGYIRFEAEPSSIKKIKEELKTAKSVLRVMIIILPKTPPEAKRKERFFKKPEKEKYEKPRIKEIENESVQSKKPFVRASELTNEELEKKLEEVLK